MTNRKQGLANYDNDEQRKLIEQGPDGMYEKGSTMDRGTAHEFGAEQVSDSGTKDLKTADEPLDSIGGQEPAAAASNSLPKRPK